MTKRWSPGGEYERFEVSVIWELMDETGAKGSESSHLLEQVRSVETRLLELRRELDALRDPLPEEAFEALEIRVDETWYALPIESIVEVLKIVWPEPLPEAPEWILGCVDIGGDLVPLIDLRHRLHGTPLELAPSQSMVVVSNQTTSALAVGEIGEVVTLEPAHLSAPSDDGLPQTPCLVGMVSQTEVSATYLLSAGRLAHEFVLEEDALREK